MADNFTTPVADNTTFGAKDLTGVKYPWNLIADQTGADAMGLVTASPAANTLLGRLKAIADGIASVDGHVDGLEAAAAGATPAGENYIGKTGGDVIKITQAVAGSTTAYASGDAIGIKMALVNAVRVAAGAGIIQAVTISSKSVQTGAVDVLFFAADPSASTFTDNAAASVAAADILNLVGVVHISDWTNLAASSFAQAVNIGLPFKIGAGTTLYMAIVARSTPALASASDLTATVLIIPG